MDDNATRQRRKRKHAAGDHSECSTARCQSARAALHSVRSALDDDSAEAGASVLDAMLALIDSTVPDGHRAGEVMARIGMRLANDFDEGELSPGLLAELRTITRWLTQLSPSADESKLDALRARRAQRRVEAGLNGTFSAS